MVDKKMLIGVITVFVLGIVIGGLGSAVLLRGHVGRLIMAGPPRGHPGVTNVIMKGIELTEEQRDELKMITDEYEPRIEDFVRRSRKETELLFQEMEGKIEDILTPEQKIRYRKNIEIMKERFKRPPPRMEGDRRRLPGPEEDAGPPPAI